MSISESKAQNTILETIKNCNKPIARKDFIHKCIISLDVPLEEYEIPGGKLNKAKCVLGKLLQQYIRTGIITESDAGILQYSASIEVKKANRDIEIENILRSITAKNIYEKDKLLDVAYAEYRKKHPKKIVSADEKNAIRGDIGRVLKNLTSAEVITCENDKFGLKPVNSREKMKQDIATISDE
ncbi:MAG: hypothetical protein K2M64_02750 [Clostridia bacterium]|nr:hypothetical protein [Clostridia bacterium]